MSKPIFVSDGVIEKMDYLVENDLCPPANSKPADFPTSEVYNPSIKCMEIVIKPEWEVVLRDSGFYEKSIPIPKNLV